MQERVSSGMISPVVPCFLPTSGWLQNGAALALAALLRLTEEAVNAVHAGAQFALHSFHIVFRI